MTDPIGSLQRALGAEIYAVTTETGWHVRRQLDTEEFPIHSLMFHANVVSTLEEHAAHHAAGIDPARFVPHTHDPQEP